MICQKKNLSENNLSENYFLTNHLSENQLSENNLSENFFPFPKWKFLFSGEKINSIVPSLNVGDLAVVYESNSTKVRFTAASIAVTIS